MLDTRGVLVLGHTIPKYDTRLTARLQARLETAFPALALETVNLFFFSSRHVPAFQCLSMCPQSEKKNKRLYLL